MSTAIEFEVAGDPQTKGSTKGFVSPSGRVIITNNCVREKPWAQQVFFSALPYRPEQPWSGPVGLDLWFFMPRPVRLGKKIKLVPCDKRPDIDKLTRSLVDALTGVFYLDDAQVTDLSAHKLYADPGEPAKVIVRVWRKMEVAQYADIRASA